MHLNDGRGTPVARRCTSILNKSFPVKARSFLQSNSSHLSLFCRDLKASAENLYLQPTKIGMLNFLRELIFGEVLACQFHDIG